MEDYSYWFGSAFKEGGGSNVSASLPPQAIPLSQKTERWKKRNLDAFETIGTRQLNDNLKFADIFRMIDGKMSYSELSDVMPQYRELEEALNDVELDTWIKHYDILGVIINALAGELSSNSDKFSISTVDDVSTNEYIRTKTDKLVDYINVEFEKHLKLRMLEMGINPDVPDDAFQSQEELDSYRQMIQEKKAEMTPSQIENYMRTSWKTVAAKWAELKLEEDDLNHNMKHMNTENFIQFLATGRCFRHMQVGFDYYKPENWHMMNTFFSQDLDNKFVQYGDYVGRIHKFTRSQAISRYGHLLTPQEQKKIMRDDTDEGPYGGSMEDNYFGPGANVSYKKMFESHFHRLQTVSFDSEPEYRTALDIQDGLGIPMGERMILNRHGEYEKVPVLLPEIADVTGNLGFMGGGNNMVFNSMRNDISLRSDLLTATEVYWRSFKRVGYLKYYSPDGQLTSTIVTEELLPEFLKFYGIETVSTVPLKDLDKDQKENTIVWSWQPEVWKGIKLTDGDSTYYLDVAPLEYQIKGDSNIFDVLLPVSGMIDIGLAPKIEPYQVMYNVIMNQIVNLLEKEIGLFFIFDINFLPSEFKDWGDTEDTLVYMRDIAKDIGILPVDSSKQNLQGGGSFNQFAAQNLSFTSQISDRMQLAEFTKNKAFEQIGITPQRLGAPNKYENAEGIKISQTASYAQTEQYFSKFSLFLKKTLEIHLAVAQYCQKEGKDLQIFFTQSDATQAFIQETDDDFQLRKFNIVPSSNSEKRKQLETFKQWLISTNTLGTDELAMAELMTSDTMSEIIESARNARIARQNEQSRQQQMQGEQAQQLQQMQTEADNQQWERQENSKQKDRETDVRVATINALGRASDKQSDKTGFDMILGQSKLSLEQSKVQAQLNTKNVENDIKQQKVEEDRQQRLDNLKLKMAELATRREISKDNVRIAEVNKN